MKLLALGLQRYGCFTGRALKFDPATSVIVIRGANEAGKSTALAAVADVLFGIEERSRFDFLHPKPTMRLSATLAHQDGRILSFARLKRRNATLVNPVDDAPLSDDCLAPFLGGHDRKTFLEEFGLDQHRLRAGGKAVLAGGGNLADTLLAAAPGLGHVIALRDRLKESAAQIFNPDRKNASHAFYRGIDKRKDARDRIRELELRVEEVKRLRDTAEQAAERRQQAVQTEIDAGLALSRAKSLVLAAKELRTLDGRLSEREALGLLPLVPADFVARARNLLTALERAQEAADRAADQEAEAAAELAAIDVDELILALAETVESCDEERAAVRKELGDLSKRRSEAIESRARLARIAAGLGLADIEALRERLPGAPLLARAESLIDRLHTLDVRSGALADEQTKAARRRQDLVADRQQLGHVVDPAPLKGRLATLDGAEERERALLNLDGRLASAREELAERMNRLNVGLAGADALAALPLPSLAAAEVCLRDVKAAVDACERQEEARAEFDEQRARVEIRLAKLHAGRPAPTDAAIATARRERDQLWTSLRPLALGERALAEDDAGAAAQLDRAIVDADRLADERQMETKRLTDLARSEQEIAELGLRIGSARNRLAEMNDRRAAAHDAWATLWAASGIALSADERAIAVLREAEAIRQARDSLRRDEADANGRRQSVQSDRERSDALRDALGLPPLGKGTQQLADAREALAGLDTRFQRARDLARDLEALDKPASELIAREAELTREKEALAHEKAELFPCIAIRSEVPLEEARAALSLWREAATLVEALATAERRVAGIERDEESFIGHVAELLTRASGAASEGDSFQTAKRLRARLDAARQARSKAESAGKTLDARRRTSIKARSTLEEAQGGLAAILEVAQVAERAHLPVVLDHLEKAAVCDGRIEESRGRFDDFRGSRREQEIRDAIAGRDDEALARLAAEAAADYEVARSSRDRAIEEDTQARSALDALDQREGAAAAAQDEQDAVAEISAAIERFTRDHVAARMLTVAIERYRERHQNPIVERASRAFATLTRDRWSGIGVDYDAESPRLAAIRDGRLHGVDALSEGTADQLFLALRIAAIEEHARRAAPLPFVADDLFVSFDEERTEAGLSLLRELGEVTQVIVFTHHAHVLACAARALKGAASIIEL